MSLIFVGFAALLAVGVTLCLGRALWRGTTPNSEIEHHAVNAKVLRDQLAELEQDVAHQILSADDFSAAKQEIQQRALQEAVPAPIPAMQGGRDKRTAAILIVTLPLAAMLLYFSLGNPAASLSPTPQNAPMMTRGDVENMVKSLETRLAQNPDDSPGWLMLARSYSYFGDYKNAAVAFSKAAPIIQTDPIALTEYAETLARNSATGFVGEPTQLLERALSIDPREPYALTLAGTAALERGDYQVAIDYWQEVLEQLPAGSQTAQIVADGIERAQQRNGGARLP